MATLIAAPGRAAVSAVTPQQRAQAMHRILISVAAIVATSVILFLAIYGAGYYSLSLEERPFSPLHSQLRSSGTIGLRIGIVSMGMFLVLGLYPLRKRWRWLSTIGNTKRWLNFHILVGITTPIIVTFHTAFRTNGIAGMAYWSMMMVALSGFVGRYVYSRIPRSLNSAKLSMNDLEDQIASLANGLNEQKIFRREDLAPLLDVPPAEEIRRMSLVRTLWTLLRMDLSRPFLLSRLRRQALGGSRQVASLGGLIASHDPGLESIVRNVRRQSRLHTAMAFLDRTERVFHLWHVVHRPFSISFAVLILVHIGVAMSVGF